MADFRAGRRPIEGRRPNLPTCHVFRGQRAAGVIERGQVLKGGKPMVRAEVEERFKKG